MVVFDHPDKILKAVSVASAPPPAQIYPADGAIKVCCALMDSLKAQHTLIEVLGYLAARRRASGPSRSSSHPMGSGIR